MRHALPGKPRDPFSAALDALRDRLADGRLVLGEPLTITDLAESLGLSATPIREALARLAGEGLIEDRRGRGYFSRRIDVADLVELYGLRWLYLAAAIEAGSIEALDEAVGQDPQSEGGERLGQVFDHLVAGSGSRALLEAYRGVCDRLAPAIRAERSLLPLAEEVALIVSLGASRDAWLAAVGEIHERRKARAGELVRAMRARANISTL